MRLLRYFVVIFALLILGNSAFGAACVSNTNGCVQVCSASGFTSPLTCNLTGVAANHVIVIMSNTCGSTSSVDDSLGTNFGVSGHGANLDIGGNCFIFSNIFQFYTGITTSSGNDTCQTTPNQSTTAGQSIICAEYAANAWDGNAVSAVGSPGGDPAGTRSSGNATTTLPGDVLLGGGLNGGGASPDVQLSAGSGYTVQVSVAVTKTNGGYYYMALEDKIAGAPGAYDASFVIGPAGGIWGATLQPITPTSVASPVRHSSKVIYN